MKPSLGILLTVGLGLAVAHAVAKLIALLIVLLALAAIVTRPKQAIVLVASLVLLNFVALYPLPVLAIAGAVVAFRAFFNQTVRPQSLAQRVLDSKNHHTKGPR